MLGKDGKLFTRVEMFIQEGQFKEALLLLDSLGNIELLHPDEQLSCYLLKSRIDTRLGQYDSALKMVETAYKIAQELESIGILVEVFTGKAEILLLLGEFEASLTEISEAERLLASLSNQVPSNSLRYSGRLFFLKGRNSLMKGDLDRGLEYLWKSLEIRETTGEKHEIAESLNNIGIGYWRKGEYEKALECYGKSLKIREELGNKQDIAASLTNMGIVYRSKGQLDRALVHYEQALLLYEDVGNELDIAAIQNNISLVHLQKGNLDKALDHQKKSLALKEEIGNKLDLAISFNNIGMIYSLKGMLIKSLEFYKQSLVLKLEIGNIMDIAATLHNIGTIYHQRGNYKKALSYYKQSHDLYSEKGNKQEIALSYHNIGNTYISLGEKKRGLKYLEKSLAIREEIGNDLEISESVYDLFGYTLEDRNYLPAEELLKRLQQIDERNDNMIIRSRFQIAKALTLKQEIEFSKLNEAAKIFQEIADMDIIDHELTIDATINLCETLLELYTLVADDQILQRLDLQLKKIKTLSERERLHRIYLTIMLIQGKLELLQMRTDEARGYFEQIRKLASQSGYDDLVQQNKEELGKLKAITLVEELMKSKGGEKIKFRNQQIDELIIYIREVRKQLKFL